MDQGKSVFIWKGQHSFSDGVSITSMVLAMSEEYDRSYFLASKDVPFFSRLLIRVMAPFYLPFIIFSSLTARQDDNWLTKQKMNKNLSGDINIASSDFLPFNQIKETSKKLKVTINDFLLCGLTTSLHTLFREKGDS